MKNNIIDFIRSKYGSDDFGIFLLLFTFVLLIISFIIPSIFLNCLILLLLIFSVFRMLSSNNSARVSENKFYNKQKSSLFNKLNLLKINMHKRQSQKSVKCMNCNKTFYVPKNDKSIGTTCPYCHKTYYK